MLGYFPPPYNQELMYSICSRFSDRMHYPTIQAVHQDLFGCKHLKAVVELPSNLDYLINTLPLGHKYTLEKLINNHTLLPFYRAFLSSEQLSVILKEMRCRTSGALLTRVGNPSRLFALSRLRFCTECVEDDRKNGEECYWHRVHQIGYVMICPIHGIPLTQSSVRSGNASNQFISAKYAVRMGGDRLAVPSVYYEFLLQIARDVDWILKQSELSHGPEVLRRKYHAILNDQGLISHPPGLVSPLIRTNMGELRRRFQAFYSRELLELLHCGLNEYSCDNWLSRLLHNNESNRFPLHHLLLVHLLGHTAETFFNLEIPIGSNESLEGPRPCLNPTCTYYRQFCIHEHKLIYIRNRLHSVISCQCGFTYRKKEVDLSTEVDPFKKSSVVAYGDVWEETLRSLWNKQEMTLSEMGRKLGMTSTAVKQHALRLGLSSQREGCISEKMKMTKQMHSQSISSSLQAKLLHNRIIWLSLMEKYPETSLSTLAQQEPKVHRWLYLRDRDWLNAHKPPARKTLPSRFIDWASRDTHLAQEVSVAAEHLRKSSPRPQRVTRNAIAMYIGGVWEFWSHLEKLPITARKLEDVTESHENFAIRRLWWTVECCRKENIYPTRQQLIRKAGLRATIKSARVENAVEEALLSLHSSKEAIYQE